MGMIIDGIATSEHLDSSGEILKIEGHDITDLVEGRGVVNFEHNNDHSDDILGAIIYAKKIMKRSDCDNERERMYWDSCGTPFVYIKSELFDDEQHPGAIAAAAIIRYYHKRKMKVLAGFSIEGSTLERKENVLERTVGRRVALTLRPCNKSAISGVLEDPSNEDIKKYMNLDAPINTRVVEVDSIIFEDIQKSDKDPLKELKAAVYELRKTLTAGGYNVAPSQLSGGSALQTESRVDKRKALSKEAMERLRNALANWDRTRPLKETIKAALPEVSDEYVDHFTEVAEDIDLKKGEEEPVRISPWHSDNVGADHRQRELIRGIYMDKPMESKTNRGMKNKTWHQNDAGNTVMVKHPHPLHDYGPTAKNATNYYELAQDYFGMGDHVPATAQFVHPKLGDVPYQAQEWLEGAHTGLDDEFDNTLKRARSDGSLHKLALMDMVMGSTSDRHLGNMLGKDGKVIHIDNDEAFSYGGAGTYTPHYFRGDNGIEADHAHVDAVKWLNQLDPKELATRMLKMGMDKKTAQYAVRRLRLLQESAGAGKNFKEMHDLVHAGEW